MAYQVDQSWMWHPNFSEESLDTAGRFLHFHRTISINSADEIPTRLKIHITADTRYKLYINCQQVSFGPVKGDASLWFYDEVDIAPYLRLGCNRIGVHVLRFFHATNYAQSFPRLPHGGLRIQTAEETTTLGSDLQSNASWMVAIDPFLMMRIDEPEDVFLHIYEQSIAATETTLQWVPVHLSQYHCSTGHSAPWKLSPRMIPLQRVQKRSICALHNLQSAIPKAKWTSALVESRCDKDMARANTGVAMSAGIQLSEGSRHQVDLEVEHHMTAFLKILFKRPQRGGSIVTITYAESYENAPIHTPFLRQKDQRHDTSRHIFGPRDIYHLRGYQSCEAFQYYKDEGAYEILMPFHFRTFRFIRLSVEAINSDLILESITIEQVTYPIDVVAKFITNNTTETQSLWTTSIRTLISCMHDCYEDCPFYEQLQYAMDTRSSILFTYYSSGDDRLARQAMIQLRNSFQPNMGLTASRAPSHTLQIIPHFSLFWILMVTDHFLFSGDRGFVLPFLPIVDAILNFFDARIDRSSNLIADDTRTGIWNYHDWVEVWRPYGVPPEVTETRISTLTNSLYAYVLQSAASLLKEVNRSALAQEYSLRAERTVQAIRKHCFDGTCFTDSLSSVPSTRSKKYSQHNQAWAILSGAATTQQAGLILRKCLNDATKDRFAPTSISMSFYLLRAMSVAEGNLYEDYFHQFWDPWRAQLALGLTTWEEDTASHRSDCHTWGSAPIYEFLAEVAGIRPARPGWAALSFKPRIALYKELNATVPFRMIDGKVSGYAHVSWSRTLEGDAEVSLVVDIDKTEGILVYVTLPLQAAKTCNSRDHMLFVVCGREGHPPKL